VSVRALRNIENGQGSTVKTLLSVVRALGRESWLGTVAPVATVNPLSLTSRASQRVRATSPAVKLAAARRLLASAGQGSSAQGKATVAPAKLHAARRLIASAKQSSPAKQTADKPAKPPAKARKKARPK
jgi:hypothetical protein